MTNFSDTFETGDLATNWPTRTGNVSASNPAAFSGAFGCRISPGGGVAGQIATSTTKWAQGSLTWAQIRVQFRMNALPVGTSGDLFTLQAQTQLHNFDFFYNNSTGTFHFDLEGAVAVTDTGLVPQLGRWYDLQALVFFGATTYTAEVQLNGVNYGVLSSPGVSSSFVRSLHIGTSSTTKTYEFDIDNVVANVGTNEPSFEVYSVMAKQSGMGDRLFVSGYDLSGDIGSLGRIGGGLAGTQDVTGIDKSAMERVGLARDGSMEFSAFFNDAAGQAHPRLSTLPTADQILTYCRGAALGSPAASLVGKQINYDPSRGADGSLTIEVQALANGFGLEWGDQLTAGVRADTAATDGTGVDLAASTAFGLQAYLHVTAFTGTDATIKIQESSDNGVGDAWADVVGGAFTQVTAGPTSQRIQAARDLTVERYLRVVTVTTGGFTALSFVVAVKKNELEVLF